MSGFSEELFPLPALDEQDEIDMANEEQLFQHERTSAEIIEHALRAELWTANPHCYKCREHIPTIDDALLFLRADGTSVLSHFGADCYSEEIAAMTLRHIANGRLRWTERANGNQIPTEAPSPLRISVGEGAING